MGSALARRGRAGAEKRQRWILVEEVRHRMIAVAIVAYNSMRDHSVPFGLQNPEPAPAAHRSGFLFLVQPKGKADG